MRTLKIVGGLALMMVALWGGSYLMDVIPVTSWVRGPTLFTSAFVGVGGYMVAFMTLLSGK
jgi:hypothetical protein